MDKKIFSPTLYPKDKNINKTWFIKYRDAAGRPQKAYGDINHYTTVSERIKAAKRLLNKLQADDVKTLKVRNNLVKALSDLLELKRPYWEEKTYQTYTSLLTIFADWYNKRSAVDKHTCPSGIVAFLLSKGYSKNYCRKFGIVFKGWFKLLVKAGKYGSNPFADVSVKKTKGVSKLPFSEKQKAVLKAAISKADPQLWLTCEISYYCYLRPHEIRQIKFSDIDDEMNLWVRPETAKDDDSAAVIIPLQLAPKLKELKERYPGNYYIFGKGGVPGIKPLGKNNLNNRHRFYVKALGLGNRYTLYSWVHTGAKAAAMSKKIPLVQLQGQKRHYSLDMFMEYLKDLKIDDFKEVRQKFPTL